MPSLFRRIAPLASVATLVAALGVAACKAATAPGPVEGAPDDGGHGDAAGPMGSSSGCTLEFENPATITVLAADGGFIACQATLTLLSQDGGPLETYCGPCAPLGGEEAGAPCTYAIDPLNLVDPLGPFTVEVSQAGFAPAIVQDVAPATGGMCQDPGPGSASTVTLRPVDAGGADDASDGSTDATSD